MSTSRAIAAREKMRAQPANPGQGALLAEGEESFSIESRIIREFGERLVKQPEVALLELIKNAYDADAQTCTVVHKYPNHITVTDDGHGMTQKEFLRGWMRIGTSSKEATATSRSFMRPVSGEKGIGRFAVRYLGRHLRLRTTAYDRQRGCNTTLEAQFYWPDFDKNEDLGKVKVPYTLRRATDAAVIGTELRITRLRPTTEHFDVRQVLTASLSLLSPYRSLLRRSQQDDVEDLPEMLTSEEDERDPGFQLKLDSPDFSEAEPVADAILKNAVLRCVVAAERGRLKLRIYRRGESKPWLRINDAYKTTLGRVYVDLRFFPARRGTFAGLPVKGGQARTWVKENSGVAVFDRDFRVLPYGTQGDDWLRLAADAARNERNPNSTIAEKHFPMDEQTRRSTQLNYMLRLPQPYQLVGAVQVYGVRTAERAGDDGLMVTADREGFVENLAFRQLTDIVRGATEAIAYADRELQLEEDKTEAEEAAKTAEQETQEAISQIRANANLSAAEKNSLVKRLVSVQVAARRQETLEKARSAALEVMSLLGVVAGFMTHEFGTALHELTRAHARLESIAGRDGELGQIASELKKSVGVLQEFVTYSQGYVRGTSNVPEKPYAAKPRIQQVLRVFGKYATDRGISVSALVEPDVLAPRVPVSLYGGIILNLYTNALKAVTARADGDRREISIRAWNERDIHRLQVSDTGVGIPPLLKDRIFDPLFTTTDSNRDPLGSGMGLGLTLVRRGVTAFGGAVNLVTPPPGFSTCFEVRFPIEE